MALVVDVSIEDNGQPCGSLSKRPVRKTPEGFAGVVYGGIVYPLRRGNIVDLNDPTFARADCNEYFDNRNEVRYFEPAENDDAYFVDFSGFYKYLVFDGSESFAQCIHDRLQGLGLADRLGASFRPASNDILYDWFIRLKEHVSRAEALEAVRVAFTKLAGEAAAGSTKGYSGGEIIERIQGLESALARAKHERDILQDDLDNARSEIFNLKSKIAQTSANLQSREAELKSATIARDAYKERFQSERKSRRAESARRVPSEAAYTEDSSSDWEQYALELDDQLQKQILEVGELRAQNLRLSEELKVKNEEIEQKTRERDDAFEKLRQNDRAGSSAPAGGRRRELKNLIRETFDCFLRRTELEDEDFSILASEVRDPRAMLEVIRKIDSGEAVDCTNWRGGQYRGLKEVRNLNVGVPDMNKMGRIYFKRDGERIILALHIKTDESEQERFVKRRFDG